MFLKRASIERFCKEKLFKSESIKHFILCYLFWLIDWLKTVPALKGPKPALDFGKAGLEGLPRPGNPASLPESDIDPGPRDPDSHSSVLKFSTKEQRDKEYNKPKRLTLK